MPRNQWHFYTLTMRGNEVEERVSDIEDKLKARKESEEKREKQFKRS